MNTTAITRQRAYTCLAATHGAFKDVPKKRVMTWQTWLWIFIFITFPAQFSTKSEPFPVPTCEGLKALVKDVCLNLNQPVKVPLKWWKLWSGFWSIQRLFQFCFSIWSVSVEKKFILTKTSEFSFVVVLFERQNVWR